jgi:hypothetical protein
MIKPMACAFSRETNRNPQRHSACFTVKQMPSRVLKRNVEDRYVCFIVSELRQPPSLRS